MLDRGLRRRFDPLVEREARAAAERVAADVPRRTCAACRRSRSTRRPRATSTTRSAPSGSPAARCASGSTSPTSPRTCRPARRSTARRYRRATSVYVPGKVEPMLPEALSNDACSLVPHQDRLAVTVELDLDGAEVVRTAFHRSLIRSDARLDYPRVDRIFAGAERAEEPWAAPLEAARARRRGAGRRARRARRARGRVGRAGVRLLARGARDRARPSEQTESHTLIEHLMIAANEAVAGLLETRKLPTLYRVHERPEPARVEHLVAQLAALDVPTPALPEAMSPQQAGDARRRDLAPGRRARAPHRPRPRGADLARAALAQAGALRAAQRRPPRAAVAALLPLHVADPALPGPDLPPRAAGGDRRGRGAAGRRRRWTRRASGARCASATPRRSSAPPTTSRAASCSSPSCSGAAGGRVAGRGDRRDRRRARSSRSATGTRGCSRCAACAATGGSSTRSR